MLITRSEPGAAETARRIVGLNLVPVIAPLLTIRAVPAALPPADRLQAMLATSGNAVDCLLGMHRHLPLLAVGAATAARARRAGYLAVHSADGDAAALAALAQKLCDPKGLPLLVAAGAGQGTALVAALRESGFRVRRRTVYAADPAPVLPGPAQRWLRERRLRAALFFSTAAARVFVRLVQHSALASETATVEALAIGTAAAAALAPLPWQRVRVALRPNQDELLALLP